MYIQAGLIHALEPSDRRCYDRKEAASYVGVSPPTFDKLVDDGSMPQPIQFLGRKVWDKHALDRAIDLMSGLDSTSPTDSLDVWRRQNAN